MSADSLLATRYSLVAFVDWTLRLFNFAGQGERCASFCSEAAGERRLARRLNDELADIAVVLHDREVPNTRGNIDHLVVAPSGIWIIHAKN